MSDETTLPTTGQPPTTTPPTDSNKKTFFGGEANFNDTTTFETLSPSEEFSPVVEEVSSPVVASVEETLSPIVEETPSSTEKVILEDFNPFDEDEEDEDEEKSLTPQPSQPTPSETTIETEAKATSKDLTFITTFLHLVDSSKQIFSLSENQQSFTILWGKNEKSTIEYSIYLVEDEENHIDLFIKKIETFHETGEDEHLLQFSYTRTTQNLDIFVDEFLLYQLGASYENPEKMSDITGKLDKFWFLFETYYTDLHKAYQEKKETEAKKAQLREIFRNF